MVYPCLGSGVSLSITLGQAGAPWNGQKHEVPQNPD